MISTKKITRSELVNNHNLKEQLISDLKDGSFVAEKMETKLIKDKDFFEILYKDTPVLNTSFVEIDPDALLLMISDESITKKTFFNKKALNIQAIFSNKKTDSF